MMLFVSVQNDDGAQDSLFIESIDISKLKHATFGNARGISVLESLEITVSGRFMT
jgi:hypothetical protein